MVGIHLRGVEARYELLSVRDYNLKRRVVDVTTRQREVPKAIHALRSVDLDVAEGTRLGLVGSNGAGKSTMLSVMAGLLPPTSGSVRVEGRVLALLGGASAGLDQEASGRANIISLGVQMGETPAAMREAADDIIDFSGLESRIDHPVYSYSSGMQARLRFSILTGLRPDVLLIDEGIGTADAAFAEAASARLESFVRRAAIMVIASHDVNWLNQNCTEGIWLAHGHVRSRGPLGQVLDSYLQSVHAASEQAVPEP